MTEWIKCDDERPPINRPFLAKVVDLTYDDEIIMLSGYDFDDDCYTGAYYNMGKMRFNHFIAEDCSRYQVTHWTELPKLPIMN